MSSLFIVLLSFSESLLREAKVSDQTKCLFLNNKTCMVKHGLVDMNSVEFKYYQFMISLNKCTGSCNVVSPKICVCKKTRHKC